MVFLQAGQQGDLGLQLGAARGHRQHREAGLGQGQRPVLEVGRRIRHGSDQRQLLQLERPLASARVAVAAAEHDGTLALRMRGGQVARVTAPPSALPTSGRASRPGRRVSSGDGGSSAVDSSAAASSSVV